MATEKEVRTWAMILHLSTFAGYTVVPMAGLLAPIIIWQVKKAEMPEIDAHGRNVVNWLISSLIYGAVCFVLVLVGIGLILGVILWALGLIFPIIGAVKASSGEVWKYPLSIKFF